MIITNLAFAPMTVKFFGGFTTEFSDVTASMVNFASQVDNKISPAYTALFTPLANITKGQVSDHINNLKSAVKKYKNFQTAVKNLKTWYDAGLGARLTQAQKVSMLITD